MDGFMANITSGETTKNYGLANLIYENAENEVEMDMKGKVFDEIENTKRYLSVKNFKKSKNK